MKKTTTARGFGLIKFKDQHGDDCSLQISSAIEDEVCCWLGCSDINLKVFVPYANPAWKEVSDSEAKLALGGPRATEILANTRMHLTQSQVKELLPHLKKFAKTGQF
jgi:hypothetical protein